MKEVAQKLLINAINSVGLISLSSIHLNNDLNLIYNTPAPMPMKNLIQFNILAILVLSQNYKEIIHIIEKYEANKKYIF